MQGKREDFQKDKSLFPLHKGICTVCEFEFARIKSGFSCWFVENFSCFRITRVIRGSFEHSCEAKKAPRNAKGIEKLGPRIQVNSRQSQNQTFGCSKYRVQASSISLISTSLTIFHQRFYSQEYFIIFIKQNTHVFRKTS